MRLIGQFLDTQRGKPGNGDTLRKVFYSHLKGEATGLWDWIGHVGKNLFMDDEHMTNPIASSEQYSGNGMR